MSFGTPSGVKQAENNLGGIASTAVNQQLPLFNAAGGNLLNMGTSAIQPSLNWWNTILQGNRANTASLLQPQIDQIRQSQAATMQGINTLFPRTGGRFGTLFSQSFAPQAQIQGLFNPLQGQAAQVLPGIGQGLVGAGTNLFGLGNQALQAGTGASSTLGNLAQQQQQIQNQMWSNLGAGILGLATLPLGGPSTLLGKAIGGIGGLFPSAASRVSPGLGEG